MRLLVCGGRDFNNRDFLFSTLDRVHARKPVTLVIQGKGKGADELAEEWATSRGIHCAGVAALWNEFGRAAGPKRNRAMLLLEPDSVIAFAGGAGTADMVKAAKGFGVRVVWEPKP